MSSSVSGSRDASSSEGGQRKYQLDTRPTSYYFPFNISGQLTFSAKTREGKSKVILNINNILFYSIIIATNIIRARLWEKQINWELAGCGFAFFVSIHWPGTSITGSSCSGKMSTCDRQSVELPYCLLSSSGNMFFAAHIITH